MAITNEADYEAKLLEMEKLMELDPDPATPEGKKLMELAEDLEEYEKEHFSL